MIQLAEAKAGASAVFFVDAAHFVLAPYLGWLWSFARIFIAAPAGRQRFNVLGALNATTHQLVTTMNGRAINADSMCLLLQKLAALSLDVPISLVLDNVCYLHCAQVIDRLKDSLLWLEVRFSYRAKMHLAQPHYRICWAMDAVFLSKGISGCLV